MFKQLNNEFKLTFNLKVDSPLSIRSGLESIDPTLPDMQCVRSHKNGENVVFIPGSSIKGVIRSRCEKILNIVNRKQVTCNITGKSDTNCQSVKSESGEAVYKELCPGCKMFGSKSLGGRIKFKDAYPIDNKFKIGYRNGVGINRITGAAQQGALYDFEVVEDGTFGVTLTGSNFELYQLKVLLWAIEDINEGYVAFGSSTTRGNGKMLVEDIKLTVRDYRSDMPKALSGYYLIDKGMEVQYSNKGYYYETVLQGIEKIQASLENVEVSNL